MSLRFVRPDVMNRLLWFLFLGGYVLDQATKYAVLKRIPLHDVIPVLPGFFNLTYVTNTGAAFGMMSDSNAFFIALSSVALLVVAVLFWRGIVRQAVTRIGCALLASGVAGNLTDRILHGHVIDFLDFNLGFMRWPAFNIADSNICIAAGLFIIASFTDTGRRR